MSEKDFRRVSPRVEVRPSTKPEKIHRTYLTSTELFVNSAENFVGATNKGNSSLRNSIHIPDFNCRDETNDDFRQKIYRSTAENDSPRFFGDCEKCGETVESDDDPCEVLGRIYHGACAVCVVCGRSVKNKYFYLKEDLFCEEDFLFTGFYRTVEHCVVCQHLITETIIQALGNSYHSACFKCSKCSKLLDGSPFLVDRHGNLFCLSDYHATYAPRCGKCSNVILPEKGSNETIRIVSMGKNFHLQCYRCEDCSIQLGDDEDRRCFPVDDVLLCQQCSQARSNIVHQF